MQKMKTKDETTANSKSKAGFVRLSVRSLKPTPWVVVVGRIVYPRLLAHMQAVRCKRILLRPEYFADLCVCSRCCCAWPHFLVSWMVWRTRSSASALTLSIVWLTSMAMTSTSSALGRSRMSNWLWTMLAPM